MDSQYLLAFALTLIAGFATVAGGSLSFIMKRTNMRVLAIGLGFSAGVMVYMALTEILKDSRQLFKIQIVALMEQLRHWAQHFR